MGKGFFITGTDTGVGKTVVTAGLLAALRAAGIDAVAFKPVQSGAARTGGGLVSQDAAFFLKVSGLAADVSDYNLYCLEHHFSPHLAAEMDGVTIAPGAILARCRELLANHQVLLVEGAGGICVPLTRTGYTVAHLARDLVLPLLVVARPSLGTINHTVLTIEYARMNGLRVAGFIFNGLPDAAGILEEDNAKIIHALTGVPLLGRLPHIPGLDVDGGAAGDLAGIAGRHLCWREMGVTD